MRRLIVCADGTWNKPDQEDHGQSSPTNVVKMQRAVRSVASDNTSQIVYYHSGVGSGDALDKLLGGAFGEGLDRNILECYEFVVNNFHEGDELYFFGFSRGAYTVRSLAGLIRNSGVLRQEYASMDKEAFSLYRDRDPAKHPNLDAAKKFRATFSHDVGIKCVGVWDTVGSLGIPIGLFEKFSAHKYAFHDVTLSSKVENAFHALAIDERRKPFAPTLWEQSKEDADQNRNWLEQAWFAGVHSNIGGGYADAGLSDIAFCWMVERVNKLCGLEFNDDYVKQIARPSHLGRLQDSMTGGFELLGEFDRQIDDARETNDAHGVHTWEYVHESVQQLMKEPKVSRNYNPPNLSKYAKRPNPVPMFAKARAAGQAVQEDAAKQK